MKHHVSSLPFKTLSWLALLALVSCATPNQPNDEKSEGLDEKALEEAASQSASMEAFAKMAKEAKTPKTKTPPTTATTQADPETNKPNKYKDPTPVCAHFSKKGMDYQACMNTCERLATVNPMCLVVLRFGAKGKAFFEAHPQKKGALEPLAIQAGFTPKQARQMRWYANNQLKWKDPNDPEKSNILPTAKKQDIVALQNMFKNAKNSQTPKERIIFGKKSIRLLEKIFGADSPLLISQNTLLGGYSNMLGNYKEALGYLEKAHTLAVKKLPADHPVLAFTKLEYAMSLVQNGQATLGRKILHEGIDAREGVFGKYHPEIMYSYYWASRVYYDLGQFARAKTFARDGLEVGIKLLTTSSGKTREHFVNYGRSLLRIGDPLIGSFAYTLANVQLTLTKSQESPAAIDVQYGLARTSHVQITDPLGSANPGTASNANPLLRQSAKNEFKKGSAYIKKARELVTKHHGNTSMEMAEIFSLWAEYFVLGAKHDMAVTLLKGGIKLRNHHKNNEHIHTKREMAKLAKLLAKRGKYEEANKYYDKALSGKTLEIYKDFVFDIAYLHRDLAVCKWFQGDTKAAKEQYKKAVEHLVRYLRSDGLLSLSELQLNKRSANVASFIHKGLSLLLDESDFSSFYDTLLSFKGVSTRVSLRRAQFRRLGNMLPKDKQKDFQAWLANELRGRTQSQDHLAMTSYLEKNVANFQTKFTHTQRKPLCKKLKSQKAALVDYFTYVKFKPDPTKHTWDGEMRLLAAVLDKRCKLKQIDIGPYKPIMKAIKEYKAAVKKAEECYAQKGKPVLCLAPFATLDARGKRVRELAFDPVKKSIKRVKNVYISPDHDLAQVAWDGLMTKKGKYLVESYNFTIIPFAGVLLRAPMVLKSTPELGEEAVVFGDIDYNNDATDDKALTAMSSCDESGCVPTYDYFKKKAQKADSKIALDKISAKKLVVAAMRGGSAEEEAKEMCSSDYTWGTLQTEAGAVAEIMSSRFGQRVHLARGDTATENMARMMLTQKRIIHIATHGFYDRSSSCISKPIRQLAKQGPEEITKRLFISDRPFFEVSQLTALVFAGANKKKANVSAAQDGYLNGYDIGRLDLGQTELAVLSACETGLGVELIGEGVLGLTRGFAIAGVRYIISSLWKVPSAPTADLFRDTYAKMLSKKSRKQPNQALRQAKIEAIKRYRARRIPNSSFMWSAFVPMMTRLGRES